MISQIVKVLVGKGKIASGKVAAPESERQAAQDEGQGDVWSLAA